METAGGTGVETTPQSRENEIRKNETRKKRNQRIMKKVLITGARSYIGTSVEQWLLQRPLEYQVDTLDLREPGWKKIDFSPYDAVFHVAGIAHQKEKKEDERFYYEVNHKLAVETARKAKEQGAGQFIILSSMSVYGKEEGVITRDTVPDPKSYYGKSKWMADQEIGDMEDSSFPVAVLRPPMVYGKGCKGNYQRLRKAALAAPVFPEYHNQRSMVYIDNLSEFVREVIDGRKHGVFQPQNSRYVSTKEMVEQICLAHGSHIHFIKKLDRPIQMLCGKAGVFQKIFGTLVYEKNDVCTMTGFAESIRRTES